LAVWAKEGDEAAQTRLVQRNEKFVYFYAMKYKKFCSHLTLEDLVAEGNIALIKAARRFDPSRGVKFITYAGWYIRHHMQRTMANTDSTIRIPVGRREGKRKNVNLGQDLRVAYARSLDAPLSDGETTLHDVVGSGQEGQEGALGRGDVEGVVVREAVAALGFTGLRKAVLEMRVMADEPCTLAEVGAKFGLSRERVRQVEVMVKERVRVALEEVLTKTEVGVQ